MFLALTKHSLVWKICNTPLLGTRNTYEHLYAIGNIPSNARHSYGV